MRKPEEKEGSGYSVGYGKPPAEHRFKKGQSDNPSGRPKGRKEERKFISRDLPTQDMILEEAYRTVSVREGDRIIELPAIQAVLRAMGVAAMKGNRFAQKTLTQIVQQVEQEHRMIAVDSLETWGKYKLQWTAEFERCERQGLPEPQQLSHPDDVILDFRTGSTSIRGPITAEEKKKWDTLLARRDEAQEEVLYFGRKMKRCRGDKSFWREQLLFEQKIFDKLNEHLPERYQKKLEGRLWVPKASND